MADIKVNGFSPDSSEITVKSKSEEVEADPLSLNGDKNSHKSAELNGNSLPEGEPVASDIISKQGIANETTESEKDVPLQTLMRDDEHSGEDSSSSSLTSSENEKDKVEGNSDAEKKIENENKNIDNQKANEISEVSSGCKAVGNKTDDKTCTNSADTNTSDAEETVSSAASENMTVCYKKDDGMIEIEEGNEPDKKGTSPKNENEELNLEESKKCFDTNSNVNSEKIEEDTNKEIKETKIAYDTKETEKDTEKGPEKQESDDLKNLEQKRKKENEDEETSLEPVKDKIDIDGDEFIITINEDNESDKEDDVKSDKDDKQDEVQKENAVSDSNSLVKLPQNRNQNDSVSKTGGESASGDNKDVNHITVKVPRYDEIASTTTVTSYVDVVKGQGAQAGTLRYLIPPGGVTSMNTSTQLIPQLVTGGSQKLPTSSAIAGQLNSKTLYSSLLSKTASEIQIRNANNSIPQKAPVSASTTATAKSEPTSASKGKERDILLPVGSWEMLDIVKWEVASHKPDNTFWTGLCNVNKKAEVSSITKFLFDLGSDIVKESAYRQITHVQQKKNDAGKLTDLEKENLDKMKKVVKELEEKLTHLSMKKQKCNGCDFTTESENVMNFHREHPHMDPPLNPHGLMQCCYCDYKTKEATEYSFHMESEHNKTGRVYSKPAFYQCGLCYFEHNQKNKLTNHKWKCMKHFKANQNQAPQHPDVNFCLKNTFYKFQIKKPAPAPTARPPPVKHNHGTRKNVTVQSHNLHTIQPKARNAPNTVNPKTPINYIRTPVAYGSQVSIANFNKNFIPVGNRMPNVLKVQSSSSVLPQQQIPPATRPQYRPATQKPTVGQLLKSKQPDKPASKMPTTHSNGFEVCEICGGYVKDKMSLRIHFFYAHKIDMPLTVFNRDQPPLICEICRNRYWTTQGLWKHKQAARHTTTQSKSIHVGSTCWICHQKQENLYSHLLKFHRLSTGECMAMKRCMFCGHLANMRKELEIHMAAAHGVIIKADASTSQNLPLPNTQYKSLPQRPVGPQTVVVGPGKAVVNTTTKTKGGQGLVRNNFCVFCSKQFSDNTQLTLHCLGAHATCSSCGMVVAKQADLSKHVCRMSSTKTCRICGTKNLRSNFYLNHLVSHTKKCSVRLKRLTPGNIAKEIQKIKNGSKRPLLLSNVDAKNAAPIKKVKLQSNPEEPIVLDSDDETTDTPTVEKRKLESESKDESEPSLKKTKTDDQPQNSTDECKNESKSTDGNESIVEKEVCLDEKSNGKDESDESNAESNAMAKEKSEVESTESFQAKNSPQAETVKESEKKDDSEDTLQTETKKDGEDSKDSS